MDYVLKFAFVLLVFIYSWLFQVENQEWDLVRSLLKDANNFAVHDAAQEINNQDLSSGLIIIDRDDAYETFQKTLEYNLGLDEHLNPKVGSRLHNKVAILKFDVIDESSGVSFPFLYEDPQYGITKYIQGPSVIAVIETSHPALVTGKKGHEPIRVPAVQEYKFNE